MDKNFMLKNRKHKIGIGDRKVVIITDHNTLTETLIEWLSDYSPNIDFYNGDQEDLTFLKRLQPEIVIFDPGLKSSKEGNLFLMLRNELTNTSPVILTYEKRNQYQKFVNQSYRKGAILQWQEYQKLPLLINSILRESSNTKNIGNASKKKEQHGS
jgi:DNA-binding NarL/FixJ family response regulator